MNQSEANDKISTAAEAAWERLQKQLVTEPVNAQWVRWSKQENEANGNKMNENDINLVISENATLASVITEASTEGDGTCTTQPLFFAETHKSGLLLTWMKQNKKWLSGVVAASVLAVTLFTPIGNQALAAILNKFRMEQVTVVQADDIQRMMDGVFTEGRSEEAINKFGAFSHTSGSINGEYSLADAEKLLNRKFFIPKDWDLNQNKVYISPSSEITLNLHVDEVNKALQHLGAKKLLPESIDGKPVKLIFAEGINISKQLKVDEEQRNISLSQMTAPSIEVDPSIPVEEAMNAVLQFPFLPDYLKDSLKNSGVLDNGKLPLPVISNGTAEKRTVEGVEVVMTQQEYSVSRSVDSKTVQEKFYNLTWVKNGQLYNLGGTGFEDPNAAFALAQELIQQ
jgi:hypothetical protein